MVQVTIDLDTSNLQAFPDKIPLVMEKGMNYTSQEMTRALMKNSPVDHGLLKSWHIESFSPGETNIKSPAKYARYVNEGHSQQPGRFIPGTWKGDKFRYDPKAKTGMVLKASYVEGKHFVEKSFDEVQPKLEGFYIKALHEVLE